jgi:sec-independent protein translocase protein TatA
MIMMILGMFGLGGPEMLLILFALLLLFGGKKIPELAKGLGKGIREFKDASNADEVKPVDKAPETKL